MHCDSLTLFNAGKHTYDLLSLLVLVCNTDKVTQSTNGMLLYVYS